jgi:hypothetical protein
VDRKLAREFVRKVQPLEKSPLKEDRRAARSAEKRLRRILRKIPKPQFKRLAA